MMRVIACGLAAAFALAQPTAASAWEASAPAKAPRPAADFAALPFLENPQLSPDGSKIAGKFAVHDQQYFGIVQVEDTSKPRLVAASGDDINWWKWVNDEWLVVGIGKLDRVLSDDFYVRRAVGINSDASKMNPLAFTDAAQSADDVLWTAKDGSSRILLAVQKSVYLDEEGFWPEVIEVDVATGRSKRVVRPYEGVFDWYADANGTVRMGIGSTAEGRSQRLLYRNSNGDGFKVLDRADIRKGESLLVPALFLADPSQAVALDDHEGRDALYKLDLKTLTLGEKIYGVDGYDLDGPIPDESGANILGVPVTEDAEHIHWFDADLAKVQDDIDKAVPGKRALIISMNKSRQRMLIKIDAPDRPGAYYLFDRDRGSMLHFADINQAIGLGRLNPVRTIRYKARDGVEIPAVLTLPANRAATNLPVIIMPHGGPFARDSEEWDWWAQFLAERGYAVVQPNFRGSSGFGTDFAKKGQGQWGLAMQDDLDDALAYLGAQHIVDPKRACVVGGSYGGYAAMRAIQRKGNPYRCAVSYAGVSDLAAILQYDGRFLNSGRGTDWLRTQAPDLKAVSPINFAADFSAPLLLMHGKIDQTVPVKQSRDMADRLRKAGKQVIYIEQPQGDHHFSRGADRLQFLQELEKFLSKNNPA